MFECRGKIHQMIALEKLDENRAISGCHFVVIGRPSEEAKKPISIPRSRPSELDPVHGWPSATKKTGSLARCLGFE